MVSDAGHLPLLIRSFTKANILIDAGGHARLADFGLLTLALDFTNSTASGSTAGAGTIRWMSPELLYPEHFNLTDSRPTKESDCYALGMVILEVLSGEVPFPGCNKFTVMLKVVEGKRPERPQGPWFTNDLWRTLEQCWSHHSKDRPTVEAVHGCLSLASVAWQPLPPNDVGAVSDESVSTLSYNCIFFQSLHSVSYPHQRKQFPKILIKHQFDPEVFLNAWQIIRRCTLTEVSW